MEIRDSLCDLGRMEIPRPQFRGMQFVATRGKQGFYKTIRDNGSKYGLQVKPQGPRRPVLSNDLFLRPSTMEEDVKPDKSSQSAVRHAVSRTKSVDTECAKNTEQSNNTSLRNQTTRVELEPDYPEDYIPPHLRLNKNMSKNYKKPMFQNM
ncbi:hypothetical protein Angca_006216 [Angiostrongylus cantonensis]|nr:hypothetical protein Angca_006216 [Angiostrongylus cantonensis]